MLPLVQILLGIFIPLIILIVLLLLYLFRRRIPPLEKIFDWKTRKNTDIKWADHYENSLKEY